MDYKEKYKNALERMKNWVNGKWNNNTQFEGVEHYQKEVSEYIFPELKEDKDEKVRKSLLEYLHTLPNHFSHNGSLVIDWIDWLEKQGEQKSIDELTPQEAMDVAVAKCFKKSEQNLTNEMKSAEESLGISSKEYNDIVDECLYGESKSSDNVEPKFHEGEWIIRSAEGFKHNAYLVKEVKDYYACEDLKGQRVTFTLNDVHKNFKLWDITKDAKDGDILAVEPINDYPSPFIAICKERGLDFFNSHCFISFDAKFYTGDTGHYVKGVHPATKEQCDLLFSKMKEAGYEWNAKKKELKKIEQKPVIEMKTPEESLGIDSDTYNKIVDECVYGEQTPAWSEEDEKLIDIIISDLERHGGKESSCYSSEINYLKSLKDRISPKQEWSEEDEKFVHGLIRGLAAKRDIHGHTTFSSDCIDITETIDWLKSLKDRIQLYKQWKPSEEQMNTLEYYMHTLVCNEHKEILFGLYADLKKLREENL